MNGEKWWRWGKCNLSICAVIITNSPTELFSNLCNMFFHPSSAVPIFPYLSPTFPPKRPENELESEVTGTKQDREQTQKTVQVQEARMKERVRTRGDIFLLGMSLFTVRKWCKTQPVMFYWHYKIYYSKPSHLCGQKMEKTKTTHISRCLASLHHAL